MLHQTYPRFQNTRLQHRARGISIKCVLLTPKVTQQGGRERTAAPRDSVGEKEASEPRDSKGRKEGEML